MLGLDARAARATWTVFLVVLSLYLVYLVRHTLVLFILALFFAYILFPLVNWLDSVTPRRFNRTACLAVVYVMLIAMLSTVGTWLVTNAAEQALHLTQSLPDLIRDKQKQLMEMPLPEWLGPIRVQAAESITNYLRTGTEEFLPILRRTGSSLLEMVGNIGFLILVPILSFLLMKDAVEIRRTMLGSIEGGPYRRFFDGLMDDLDFLLAKYIRALALLSIATFVAYSLVLSILGVRYALLLGLVAALLEFIPVLGPLTAAGIALIVSAFNGYPHLLWLVIFFVVYRLIQDYVISPYLMSEGIELHPLVVILGALAGEQVAGVLGMFLSVPVLAALRVVFVRIRKARAMAKPVNTVVPVIPV